MCVSSPITRVPTGAGATKLVLLSIVVVPLPSDRLRIVPVAPSVSANAMMAPPWRTAGRVQRSSRTVISATILSFAALTKSMPRSSAKGSIACLIAVNGSIFSSSYRRWSIVTLVHTKFARYRAKFLPTRASCQIFRSMSEPNEFDDLVSYLVRTSRLGHPEASRLVGEVLSFLDERPEEFVCRRHRALQGEGLSNSEIFARIAAELERWRFRAPAYSERQLRRLIYG